MPKATQAIKATRAVLENDDAFATSLLAICLDEYQTDCFEWDPETLWMNLAGDFNVKIPRVNKDKLQAIMLVYTSNLPLVSVEAFNNVCNVFSGAEANFARWDILTAEEALWGIYEIMLNIGLDREDKDEELEFSHEVRQYLGVVLRDEGMHDPPDILRIAEGYESSADLDDWSDDPEFYNAAFDLQKQNKMQLLEFLGQRILDLTDELSSLPLNFGEEWSKFRDKIEASAQRLVKEHQSASMART